MFAVLLGIVVIIMCCATTPETHLNPQRTSAVIPAPKDKVWPLVVAEVGLRYPIQAIEKDSGLISTQFVRIPVGYNNTGWEEYVFPPKCFLCTWDGLRMALRIFVIEAGPQKTSVIIKAHYEAFEDNVSHSWVVVRSNGALENFILTNIERKINSKQKAK